MYQSLRDQLQQKDQVLRNQEPIRSEVEVVKKQLEENKVCTLYNTNLYIHVLYNIRTTFFVLCCITAICNNYDSIYSFEQA